MRGPPSKAASSTSETRWSRSLISDNGVTETLAITYRAVVLNVNTTPNNWVIPMDVETSVGPNWGELFPIDYKDPDLHPIEVEDKAAATVNSPADGDELFDDFEVEDEDEAFEESLLSY